MKTFAGQQIEPLFQFSWLVVFLTLLLCGSVAVLLGFTVNPKLAIAVSLTLLAVLYIFFGMETNVLLIMQVYKENDNKKIFILSCHMNSCLFGRGSIIFNLYYELKTPLNCLKYIVNVIYCAMPCEVIVFKKKPVSSVGLLWKSS